MARFEIAMGLANIQADQEKILWLSTCFSGSAARFYINNFLNVAEYWHEAKANLKKAFMPKGEEWLAKHLMENRLMSANENARLFFSDMEFWYCKANNLSVDSQAFQQDALFRKLIYDNINEKVRKSAMILKMDYTEMKASIIELCDFGACAEETW